MIAKCIFPPIIKQARPPAFFKAFSPPRLVLPGNGQALGVKVFLDF